MASTSHTRLYPTSATQHHKNHSGNIPLTSTSSQSRTMDRMTNENIFRKPALGLPSLGAPMKRKLSRVDLNPNKVHLRRQSNSFADSDHPHYAPLGDRPVSSLDHDTNTKALPTLVLAPFEPAPWIEFGSVTIGTKKMATLLVENRTEQTEKLTLDPSCKMEEKGFNILQLDPLNATTKGNAVEPLVFPPRSKMEISISWTPLTATSIRASAILKTNTGRFMVNMRGRGEPVVSDVQEQFSKAGYSSIRLGKGAGTAFNPRQSALKQSVMRQSVLHADTTNAPIAPSGYSTLPYVTTNEMYDEKWIDKQERSFSQWLNYEFNVTVDSFSPKDPSSWSYYSHKLEFEHTRASACKIYQSDTFRIVLRKVEESIGRDRLQVRPDCNLVGDVGIRREIIDLLFSFDIRWLVLGLETITGKATAMNPSFDRAMISGFINKAIFHDKQVEAEFEPDRILSNRSKFNQAMNKLVLKRIFMLILFLDKAKLARLIPSDPCLFNKDSEIKASRGLLLTISKNYLLGEGDIIRHMLFMGYSVLHTQAPLDEFDFTVKNLAVDLRDGVRLCRLVDLHCPELSLSLKMKFPTLSKSHMQQNVSLALNALVKQGISLEGTRGGVVSSRDIVEGHREKTFGLLWKLILNWKVSVLLDLAVLEAEIDALKLEYKRLRGYEQPDRVDTVYFTSDQLSALLRWCQAIGSFYNISISNFTTSFADGRGFGALLSYYHPALLDMNEMKDSAKYLEEYKQGMHQNEPQVPDGNDGKGWFIDARDIKDPVTQAKEMDRFNYRLLHNKVQALGGVPITLRHSDMSNVGVPDEKAVILFITYLCARLMHLNKDIRAAKTIQRIWRKKHYGRREETRIAATLVIQRYTRRFLSKKHLKDGKRQQEEAAIMIQAACRGYLAQLKAIEKFESVLLLQQQCKGYLCRLRFVNARWAASTIQRYYRGYASRKETMIHLQEHRAAQAIQASARGYLARKEYLFARLAVEVIQTRWRAILETRRIRKLYLEMVNAATKIQICWRAVVAGRQVRQEYLYQRDWVVRLQAQIRARLLRQKYLDTLWAAMTLQRRFRDQQLTRTLTHEFKEMRWAASVIQAQWRAVLARRVAQAEYQGLRWAAVKIQSVVRGHAARRQYFELQQAAVIVQRRRRALVLSREQERHFLDLRYAARVIQERRRAVVLGRAVRVQFLNVRATVVQMQAAIRGHLLRERLVRVMRENQASMLIQAAWRGCIQRRAYHRLLKASIVIQQTWRAVQQRRRERILYQEYQWAAVVAQRWWRACKQGHDTRAAYHQLRAATISIQAIWRGNMARKRVLALKTIVRMQAVVRMRFAQWEFQQLRSASLILQRHWRARQMGLEQRSRYETVVRASTVLQRKWRAVREGRAVQQEYQATRQGVMMTQAHIRGAMVRQTYSQLRWAALAIQRRWRARAQAREVRLAYVQMWEAARTIQDAWRGLCLTRRQRHAFLDLKWATLTIQQRWRQILYTRAVNQQQEEERHAAAVMIQAAVRGCLLRNQVRQHLAERERVVEHWVELSSMSLAAIIIQRGWRRFLDRRDAEIRETGALIIQRWWRRHVEIQQGQQLVQSTYLMQTQIRGFLARQRYYRQQYAIVKMQSWWRGHVVRQECTAKIKAARKRIEHANATAEEHMKLGNRTTMALDILLSSGQLSAVLKACYHLDVVTRLSKNSCLRLVEHNVVNIIFQLIKSCNRSQPHMEVLKHGLNIIENLSRDLDTIGSVFWAPEGIEILVDSAQAYRENEMVFESVVTILLIHLDSQHPLHNPHQYPRLNPQNQNQNGQEALRRDLEEAAANRRRVMRAMGPEVKKLKGVLTVMERKVERETRGKNLQVLMASTAQGTKPLRALISTVGRLRKVVELLQ